MPFPVSFLSAPSRLAEGVYFTVRPIKLSIESHELGSCLLVADSSGEQGSGGGWGAGCLGGLSAVFRGRGGLRGPRAPDQPAVAILGRLVVACQLRAGVMSFGKEGSYMDRSYSLRQKIERLRQINPDKAAEIERKLKGTERHDITRIMAEVDSALSEENEEED